MGNFEIRARNIWIRAFCIKYIMIKYLTGYGIIFWISFRWVFPVVWIPSPSAGAPWVPPTCK